MRTIPRGRRKAVQPQSRKARLIAILALITMFVGPASLSASDFGSDFQNACDDTLQSQCTMDANPVPYKLYSVTSAMAGAMAWARDQVYDPTDLQVSITTSESTRKVRVFDDPFGNNGLWGFTLCAPAPLVTYGGNPYTHTAWCKPQDVVFNNTYVDPFPTLQKYYVACHEFGHAIGLRHYNTDASCMKANDSVGGITITDHERSHINARF